MLQAIFWHKAINKSNTYLELEKSTLVALLKECGLIKVPKAKQPDPPKDEGKKKPGAKASKEKEEEKPEVVVPAEELYLEADAMDSVAPVNSFEEGCLNYFDMLECLLRVARDYKFTAELEATMTTPTKRLEYVLEALNGKFGSMIAAYEAEVESIKEMKTYLPKSVVEDDDDAGYEDDD